MPLKVEYAPSGRATCSLRECGKRIAKDELRIGTLIVLPFGDGAESWKWRHLCCFTARQLGNAAASGELDSIAGYDELAESDRQLVDAMRRGELVGKTDIVGRVGDIAHSSVVRAPAARSAARKTAQKHMREDSAATSNAGSRVPTTTVHAATTHDTRTEHAVDTGAHTPVDSDATDECDVEVSVVAALPRCPLGRACYRTNPDHFAQYTHDEMSPAEGVNAREHAGALRRRPFIKSCKSRHARPQAHDK